MDMIGVDVTDASRNQVAVGDEAILWGPELPVEKVAQRAGTIPYELLCAISQRVPITVD
jgi:alanine racemase